MRRIKHLSWDNFQKTVFVSGQQGSHRLLASPRVDILGDGLSGELSLLIELRGDADIPASLAHLTSITIKKRELSSLQHLEVATRNATIQRQFYHFAIAVAERISDGQVDPIAALGLELESFVGLFREASHLSVERQIGLLGELMFLEHLIIRTGVSAVDTWIGPYREPHDFRVKNREFEVKATVYPKRIHTIHGVEQLMPSNGCTLTVISILFGPAAAGMDFSLPGKAASVTEMVSTDHGRSQRLAATLEAAGLPSGGNDLYTRRWSFRRPFAVIPVDSRFPTISRHTLRTSLGELATRVDRVTYEVDVEGLEHEQGSAVYEATVP
jgi:hypothetical protein